MTISKAQFEVVTALGELKKPAKLEQLVKETGRTTSSVRGLLTRLKKSKYISERGGKYRLLKAGQVALIAQSTNDEFEKTLKQMRLDEIQDLKDSSWVHLTGLLLNATNLPQRALNQLSELVQKHDLDKGDNVGVEMWPGHDVFRFNKINQTRRWPGRGDKMPNMVSEVFATFTVRASNPTWGSGRIYMESWILKDKIWNSIDYPAGFEFSGAAAEKVARELKRSASGGVRFQVLALCETNYIGSHKGTGNPRFRCLDIIELVDDMD